MEDGHYLRYRVVEVGFHAKTVHLDVCVVKNAGGELGLCRTADVDAFLLVFDDNLPIAVTVFAHSQVGRASSCLLVLNSLGAFDDSGPREADLLMNLSELSQSTLPGLSLM